MEGRTCHGLSWPGAPGGPELRLTSLQSVVDVGATPVRNVCTAGASREIPVRRAVASWERERTENRPQGLPCICQSRKAPLPRPVCPDPAVSLSRSHGGTAGHTLGGSVPPLPACAQERARFPPWGVLQVGSLLPGLRGRAERGCARTLGCPWRRVARTMTGPRMCVGADQGRGDALLCPWLGRWRLPDPSGVSGVLPQRTLTLLWFHFLRPPMLCFTVQRPQV